MEESSGIITRLHVLTRRTKLSYSVGHVFNDLCSSMWFTYLLVYLHFVLQFNNKIAGILLLIGQVADALATPFVGIESDRRDNYWCCRYGRRKTWHLVGTVCVSISFPFLFLKCIGCENAHQFAQFVYYAAFIVIFQFGWAAVQISHLSLIPDLTPFSSERVELNAYRYACTVASNILVYLIAWLTLGLSAGDDKNSHISPKDAPEFMHILVSVMAVGIVFSVIFHIGVREPAQLLTLSIEEESINTSEVSLDPLFHLTWRDWFKEIQFYQIGMLYMVTRLYNNLSQVYIPLYLQDSLQLQRESIAIIPLVVYISGFVSSFFMKFLSSKAGKKPVYFVGCILGIGASVWLYLGKGNAFRYYELYGVSILIGAGGSTMLIISLALTSDLIGHNTSSGAFVFGAMSFLDKLSNGIAVFVVQDLHPCLSCCKGCQWYYEYVLVYACGGSAIIALIILCTLLPTEVGAQITKRGGILRNNRVNETDRKAEKEESAHNGSFINDDTTPLILESNDDKTVNNNIDVPCILHT